MRAALGRMGFLAGPLKHARPFLALVYISMDVKDKSWQLLRDSARGSVDCEVLPGGRGYFARTATSRGTSAGGEIFRVDAKADAGVGAGNHLRAVPQVRHAGFP